jgi:hypothetical protein
MATLESRIDDLYGGSLADFIAARKALASDVKGADAQHVKQLKKPTVVPWAVNQVYWHKRDTFERLLRAGSELRRAQISALEGKRADVRASTEAHRAALAAAVDAATHFMEEANANPDRDALARTFEAVSLAPTPPEPLGRLTQALRPGGFEMLAGIQPAVEEPKGRREKKADREEPPAATRPPGSSRGAPLTLVKQRAREEREEREAAAAAREQEREAAAAAREREKALKEARANVARALEREAAASDAWKRAKEDLEKARRALADLEG